MEGTIMRDHHAVSRRQVLGMAIAAGGFAVSGAVSSVFAQSLKRTPGEILGPFYPVLRSVEKTADLTVLPGKPGRAAGIHASDRIPAPGAARDSFPPRGW